MYTIKHSAECCIFASSINNSGRIYIHLYSPYDNGSTGE